MNEEEDAKRYEEDVLALLRSFERCSERLGGVLSLSKHDGKLMHGLEYIYSDINELISRLPQYYKDETGRELHDEDGLVY